MIHPINHRTEIPAPVTPSRPVAPEIAAKSAAFHTVMTNEISRAGEVARIPVIGKPQAGASQAAAPSSPPTTPASSQPILCHTPCGDVMVDPTSTPNLQALFSTETPATTATSLVESAPQPPAPTAESVFGPNPWMTSPSYSGLGNTPMGYNPIYFATPQTAAKVAAMLGGVVVQQNAMAPYGPLQQTTPNQMVLMPDGKLINPGLVADFYNHGYPQSYINQMIQAEIRNT